MHKNQKYKSFFLYMMGISFLKAFSSLLSPILLQVWSGDETGITKKRIWILFLILLTAMGLDLLLTILREKFAKYYNIKNFQDFMKKYFRLDYDYILDQGPTKLVERSQQAVNHLYNYMTGSAIEIWSGSFVVIIIFLIMASQNLALAMVMLAMLPLNYFGYKLLNKELTRRSITLQKESAAGFQQLVSFAGQTDYLKQCGEYENLLRQMKPAMERIYGSMASVNMFAQGASKVLSTVNHIVKTMLTVIIVYQYLMESGSPMVLVLITVLFPVYFNHLSVITNANLNRQGFKVSMDFYKSMEEWAEPDGTIDIGKIQEITIAMDELVIRDKALAHNINGSFQIGDMVWIKGESGKGKSTLVKYLLKFRQGDGIFVNGTDIREYTNASVRKRINYFSQNVPIVQGSLRENLFFNRAWNQKDEDALKEEALLKGILKNRSFDDPINENGANLSGGEKQKIALARGLKDEVDVMILDEVTSNIDRESAEEILTRIKECSGDKIIFILSHDALIEKYVNKELELSM